MRLAMVLNRGILGGIEAPTAMPEPRCATCGGEMVQKGRLRLFLVGVLMVALSAVAVFLPHFWGAAIILVPDGVYLIVWATLGRGLWCRTCKKFGISRRARTVV
jgi:hypothetical protein